MFAKRTHSLRQPVAVNPRAPEQVIDFYHESFFTQARSPHHALIIGSSLHPILGDEGIEESFLDAGSQAFHFDPGSTIQGFVMTSVDGLGGGEDPQEDDSIATVASYVCRASVEKFVSAYQDSPGKKLSTDESYRLALETGKESIDKRLSMSRYQKYDSHTSFSLCDVFWNPKNHHYDVAILNVGDSITVVYDPETKKTQYVTPARVCQRGFGIWSPTSLQMIASDEKKNKEHCIQASIALRGGEYIIQMTDGVWAELEQSPQKKSDFIDTIVSGQEFEAVFLAAENHLQSSLLMANALILSVLKKVLEKRSDFKAVYESLLSHFDELPMEQTLGEVLDCLPDNELRDRAKALLCENRNDGIQFTREAPIYYVVDCLKKKFVGDCSTLNVCRVPYRCDELVRALLSEPCNLKNLLEINQYSADSIHMSLDRLSKELADRQLDDPNRNKKPHEIQLSKLYSDEEIRFLKGITNAFSVLNEILNSAKSKAEARENAYTFLIGLEDPTIACYLFDALKDHPKILHVSRHFLGRKNYSPDTWLDRLPEFVSALGEKSGFKESLDHLKDCCLKSFLLQQEENRFDQQPVEKKGGF